MVNGDEGCEFVVSNLMLARFTSHCWFAAPPHWTPSEDEVEKLYIPSNYALHAGVAWDSQSDRGSLRSKPFWGGGERGDEPAPVHEGGQANVDGAQSGWFLFPESCHFIS